MKQKNLNMVKGFTLVELLVVVAIIAILSVIGLTIFTSAQANARDARRKSDIDAIAAALETVKTPGTMKYTTGPATTQFSSGVIPDDSTRYYCIGTSARVLPLAWTNPTSAWTTACPTVTGGVTPSGGSAADVTYYRVNAIIWPTVAASIPTGWNVCAILESGSVYCKPSAQ